MFWWFNHQGGPNYVVKRSIDFVNSDNLLYYIFIAKIFDKTLKDDKEIISKGWCKKSIKYRR